MKRGCLFISILILFSTILSASCEEGQIDINEASAEELDKLYGIGPARAQAIIDSRPFDSVEDLIDVIGIGKKTLEGIKSQNLACVNKEVEENDKVERNVKEKEDIEVEKIKDNVQEPESLSASFEETTPEIIRLTTQTIKMEENSSYKNRNVVCGLIGFCCLLAFLFFLRSRRYKNEFR